MSRAVLAAQKRTRRLALVAKKVPAKQRSDADVQAIRDEQRDAERERWRIREKLRTVTTIRRQQACGLPGVREDSSVSVRVTETPAGRRAGFSGLFSCGNVWTCPHCSRKVAASRALEIQQVMAHYLGHGGHAALITLTLRHHRGQSLAKLWDGVSAAWGAVTKGRPWRTEWARYGVAGWVRATEVTHGHTNGWHPHCHVLVFFHGRPSSADVHEFADRIFDRWQAAAIAAGLDAPEKDHHGLDVQELSYDRAVGKTFESVEAVSQYVAKGLALETTWGAQKDAKNGNRTTMALLRDALTDYELELADGTRIGTQDQTARGLWREYEQASFKRRQLSWCKDPAFRQVRHMMTATADKDDEEIAEEELGSADDDIAIIPADQFHRIRPIAWELKVTAAQHGADAARQWLTDHGVIWHQPHGLTEHFRQHIFIGQDQHR